MSLVPKNGRLDSARRLEATLLQGCVRHGDPGTALRVLRAALPKAQWAEEGGKGVAGGAEGTFFSSMFFSSSFCSFILFALGSYVGH